MGEILVHEFMTLDGVIDTPTWTAEFGFDPKMGGAIGGLMGRCSAILLGRRTYEMFAPVWSQRTAEDDPGAPFFNDTPKHVVSSSLREATWQKTEIFGAYDAGATRDLKESADGGLYVSGSGTLVSALLEDGLVDELHLFAYPLVSGGEPRLFGGSSPVDLKLETCEQYENGVLYLVYRQGD
jgi:dihydrofolate reductase